MFWLVTGGAGFIGSHLVEELLRRGERVRILDNFSTGKRENIEDIKRALDYRLSIINNLEVIEGDIRSYHIVREAVKGIDYILHEAALPSVPRSIKDPITTNEVNTGGTLNILESARDTGVRKVIYASSSSVYGNAEILPKQETMAPAPVSPYAVSKLASEKYCQIFYEIYELETVILRYFNIFGPRQDPSSQYSAVIPKFISSMINKKQPTIYGDGEQSRDFTYVSNVVQANLLAVEATNTGGKVFNIACGKKITVNDLVKELNKILNKNINPIYTASMPGEVRHSLAEIKEAKSVIGYGPLVTFTKGLKKTIKYFLDKCLY
ncbi:SDR family oxidoreductase [candidate division WOR-3 bacterium]|nr:SDR family oxidoreductase [candidate division WOR-3 bacterium]